MRTTAVLAVLVGALEVLNAISAVSAMPRAEVRSLELATIVFVIAAAALLAASGAALFIRRQRAIGFARVGALACLVVFAALAGLHPIFSFASMALGIAFPIGMLAFLQRRSSQTPVASPR